MIRNISQRIFNRPQLNFSLLVFHLQVISPIREYSQVWIRVLNVKELLWHNTYVILHPYFWGCSELLFVFCCWEALKRNLNSENAVLDKYIYTSYLLTSLRRTNSKLVSWFLWPMSKAVVIPRTQSCCGYSLVSPIGKSFPIGVREDQSLSTNSWRKSSYIYCMRESRRRTEVKILMFSIWWIF